MTGIKTSDDSVISMKQASMKTFESNSLKLPYFEFDPPLLIPKKNKAFIHHYALKVEKLADCYYEVFDCNGISYLYDAKYHTILGKMGKCFQAESLKECYHTTTPLIFHDKIVPYKTQLFQKIKPFYNQIHKLYLLDGSCYLYDLERNEIIGPYNHQLNYLSHCTFEHLIGYLYAISNAKETYIYDIKNNEIIETVNSKEDFCYRSIPNVENEVIVHTKYGEFLYQTKSGKILTPMFSMIGSFRIYNHEILEYSEATFKTYLCAQENSNYITGVINLDGTFVDKAITHVHDGHGTVYYLDNGMENEKNSYQKILSNLKNK